MIKDSQTYTKKYEMRTTTMTNMSHLDGSPDSPGLKIPDSD